MIEYEHWIDADGIERAEPICSFCGKMDFEEETEFTADGKAVCANCWSEHAKGYNEWLEGILSAQDKQLALETGLRVETERVA